MNPEGVALDLREGLVPVAQRSLPAEDEPQPEEMGPLEWAWVIVANASGGNWNMETPMWQHKAREWADTYCGEPFPDKEMPVAMGRALALITRVNPVQSGEWRAAAAVWCRRHDTEEHRAHLYPFTVVPLWVDWVATAQLAPPVEEGYV